MPEKKLFWTTAPSNKNAVDLFEGQWASDLGEVDPSMPHAGTPLFAFDPRPRQAAAALGQAGRLDGLSVLELGPLEGAHSYQLEKLGAARITAIEANSTAFLKCLIIKNMLSLDRTTFLPGDCMVFLEAGTDPYDLVFACGILYHMENPARFLQLIAARTRKIFIWTQYYAADFRYKSGKALPHKHQVLHCDGLQLDAYRLSYAADRFRDRFWGGNQPTTCWLTLDGITTILRHFGFDAIDIIENDVSGEQGPAVTLAASKT